MPRLSDRAFHIVKAEIERRYTDNPTDQIERVILLARLEALRASKGAPMTRVQIWEVLSDVAPNFNQNVLMDAESVEADSPMLGASIGVGAVAVLVAAAIGMDALTPRPSAQQLVDSVSAESSDSEASKNSPSAVSSSAQSATEQGLSQNASRIADRAEVIDDSRRLGARFSQLLNRIPLKRNREDSKGAFETAKALGWQAALNSQDPPHSAQHWDETAVLWEKALAALNQVPARSPHYAQAQLKKRVYHSNLQEIRSRQVSAANQSGQTAADTSKDLLAVAKDYGWQAAVASQNAPHPPEQWADISRLWQAALLALNQMNANHPHYAEAQRVKAQYQQNLSAIRDRYQQEQIAAQRLQSLQASLDELNNSVTPAPVKYGQMESILQKLRTIPTGTRAHAQAQQLIADTTTAMNAIALTPEPSLP